MLGIDTIECTDENGNSVYLALDKVVTIMQSESSSELVLVAVDGKTYTTTDF
ncbi:MAG: hypothetical protein J6T31_02050 [Methanobrevibacter sp.]|nr:hypothetical protein [Methanobrevibacter sp.]